MPVFPDASGFTINEGTFNEVHGNSVHNTSSTVYNVYLTSGTDTHSQLEDNEKRKELIFNIERIIAKQQGGEILDKVNEDTSDDTDTNNKQPELPQRLIIYTNVDILKKKLKTAVEIIFTLTPSGLPLVGRCSAIVWKTLKFQPGSVIRHDICWYNKVAFCVVKEKDSIIKPGALSTIVESKHLSVLRDINGILDFSSDFEIPLEIPLEKTDIALVNTLLLSQRFALCTVDRKTDQLLPVVDIGSMRPNDIFLCGFPVMVQAYAVNGFTEGMPIDTSKLLRPLFVDNAGKLKPLDIRRLGPYTAFRLYSNSAGRIILEED